MTSTLAILGDSLFDAQNTFTLSSLLGQNPFSDPIYDGGGNTKASDGLVLGEQIAVEMGGTIGDAQNFTVLSFDSPSSVDVHNYAHAGARSGSNPQFSLPVTSESIGIGLFEQVKAFKSRKEFYKSVTDVDVIISCGGNDMLDALELRSQIRGAAKTTTYKDDKELALAIARPIVKRIKKATRQISGMVDEIVITGSVPITETPEVQQWALGFKKSRIRNRSLNILDRASEIINRRLNKSFFDNPNVIAINGSAIWDQIDQPSFVDTIHPDTATSQEIAELIVAEASSNLNSFGF